MVAAAERDVPGGIRSGAYSQSATALTRPMLPRRHLPVTRSPPGLPLRVARGRMGGDPPGTEEDP